MLKTEDVGKLAIEKLIEKVNSGDFNLDEVTGATYSSKAFINAFADAINKSGLDYKKILKNNPTINEKFETKEMNVDVVVVGSGGAGLIAAIKAKQAGANVVTTAPSSIPATPWSAPTPAGPGSTAST